MTSQTHIFFAQFCLAFASIGQGIELNTANALACAIGSLSPDIDNSTSFLGRLIPISKTIERKFGHRTIFHSIFAILLLIALAVAIKTQILASFTIGYISHILIDCTSIQGVKIFYPLSIKNAVFPFDTQQPEAYRIKVGSTADIVLGFIFLILTLPFAYISIQSHKKIIREIQKDINSAVRTYNELAKDFICFAQIDGINTTTHEHIKGIFLIISAEKQNMLLIKNHALTLSVGKDNFKNDIFTTNILTIPSIKAKTEIKTLSIQNQSLSSVIDTNDTLIFISGEFEFYEPISTPPRQTKFEFFKQTSENKLKLSNATTEFLNSIDINDKIIKTAKITIKKIYPEHSKLEPSGPFPKEIASPTFQLIEINNFENLRFTIKEGDTIKEGQTIAFIQTTEIEKLKIDIDNYKNELNLIAGELKSIEKKFKSDTTELNLKIKEIDKEISHRKELSRRGLLHENETDLEKQKEIIKAKIQKLTAELELKKLKLETKQKQTQNKIKEIQLKINQIEAKHTIKATATGILKQIKESSAKRSPSGQISTKNKKQFLLTFEPR